MRKRSISGEAGRSGDELELVALPEPMLTAVCDVGEALRRRCTIRDISAEPLPLQTLSDLLWAACGVNRKDGPFGLPGRTAASASNSQEIDVYVAMAAGAYLYHPFGHHLAPVVAADLRPQAIGHGQHGLGAQAPVRLIYVADIHRLSHTAGYQEPGLQDPEVQRSYYYVDTGLIAGNVYLFAASLGLAAWFHNCDKPALSAALRLRTDQRPLFAQTVGYPLGKGHQG